MKLLIGWLIYALPGVAHDAILWLTKYRLIEVRSGHTGLVIEYTWTRQWPIPPHFFDKRFPVERKRRTIE